MSRMDGRRVLITDAGSGIGRAAAERFAASGADLALVARGRQGLQAAARAARRHGAVAHVVEAESPTPPRSGPPTDGDAIRRPSGGAA